MIQFDKDIDIDLELLKYEKELKKEYYISEALKKNFTEFFYKFYEFYKNQKACVLNKLLERQSRPSYDFLRYETESEVVTLKEMKITSNNLFLLKASFYDLNRSIYFHFIKQNDKVELSQLPVITNYSNTLFKNELETEEIKDENSLIRIIKLILGVIEKYEI